jgi:hypothetical protein
MNQHYQPLRAIGRRRQAAVLSTPLRHTPSRVRPGAAYLSRAIFGVAKENGQGEVSLAARITDDASVKHNSLA